jgi:Na+-transporting methylmalonyl-CoA/oxaloacetate decarboxylase gamma subunit
VTTLATPASNSAAPGTLAFIVIFGLVVILVFVFRSMSKHIRKVNDAARREEDSRAAASATSDDDPGRADTSAPTGPDHHSRPRPRS